MTELWFESGSARLHARQQGAGPDVVFLHAGVTDARLWDAQLEALSGAYRATAYDRRGFGQTTYTAETFSHLNDLLSVLDAQQTGRAVLVGCSQGGRVALNFTLAHPERVAGLVLVAPAVGGAPQVEDFPAPIQTLVNEMEAAEEAGDLERLNTLEAHAWLDGPAEAEGRVSGPDRDLFLNMNAIALRALSPGEEREEAPAWLRLNEIRAPTLVVCGDLDFPHLQDRCAHIARTVPGARSVILPGTAHLPSLEQPERFNAVLNEFLNSLDL